jgi:hypothetical protein
VIVRRGGAAIVVLVLSATLPARAYERTTIDGMPTRPIFWSNRSIGVELASHSSTTLAPTDLRAAFDRSIATWTRASGCTDIVLTDTGEALSTTTNLDGGPIDHHNRVVVRQTAWPAMVAPETLALTTVIYDPTTAAILDADTDINATSHTFSTTDPPPPTDDDVQNTLTHEMGHLLGFAHSPDPRATMYASAGLAETSKRLLGADDVQAICETYPIGAPTPTTWAPPSHASCAVAGARSWLALAAIVIALAARAIARARSA